MTVQTADVVVIGAGMVGLSAAVAFAQQGLQVVVLEQKTSQLAQAMSQAKAQQDVGYDSRVSALTCASEQWLKSLGAWPLMQGLRIHPYTDMDVWDGEGSGHIHFSSRELHEPHLGHIVENRVTVAALMEIAAGLKSLTWVAGVSVEAMSDVAADGTRQLTCSDGQLWQTALVVAADGAMSGVRRMASIPMWEWDYGHHAIVTTVTTEKPHRNTAWQRFTDDGPLAFLPLSDPHSCSIVWSTSPDHARDLMSGDDQSFCDLLTRSFEQRLGQVQTTAERSVFPLRQRHAKYYVKAALAVIGDAAHTIHPLAGQGVNLGLMDAAALVETVLQARNRGDQWSSEAVLLRYQRQRQAANIQMSAGMEFFKQLFGHQQPLLKLIRNTGMNTLNKLSPIKQHIVMQAMGLKGDLPAKAQRKSG